MSLSFRQKAFADRYLANGGNATRAYIDAGYSERGAMQSGHRMLRNAEVSAYIAEKTAAAVAEKAAEPAHVPSLTALEVGAERALRLLAEIAEDAEGEKTCDRLRALELIMRNLGMLKEKVDHTHWIGGGLPKVAEPTEEVLEAARAFALTVSNN